MPTLNQLVKRNRNSNVLDKDFEGTVLLSMIFASDQLMDYFFEVPAEFSHPERPPFQAQGGYLGTSLIFGASREMAEATRFFIGLKMDYYGFSMNDQSPLFKDPLNMTFAFGFSYRLLESEERAGARM
jgi:hypothetical protein